MEPNGANVTHLPLRRDAADGDLPLPVEELARAVDAIRRCLAEISSEPRSGAGFGRPVDTLLLLHISTVQQRLEKLSEIKVTTWPDVRWALHFSNARIRAITYMRAPEVAALSSALGGVRDLIVTRYPQTLQAC
jgi:translation elongation factor EF-4